jgi:hypothetical protein
VHSSGRVTSFVAMRVRVRSDAHSHIHASDLTYPPVIRHIHVKNYKFRSCFIFRLGSYKTWCSTRINFRSFTFPSQHKLFMENLNQFYLQMILVLYLPIIISKDLKNNIKIIFESLNKWFKVIRLSQNFYQTHFMHSHLKLVLELIYILIMLTNEFTKLVLQNSLEYM